MKAIFKVVIVFVVLSVLGVVIYLQKNQSIVQEQKYLFSIDLIRSLKVCLESREGEIGDDRLENLQTTYSAKEKLLDAKNMMHPWKDSKNENIRKSSEAVLQGLDQLILAQDLFVKIFNGTSGDSESDVAFASAKLQSGRKKMFKSSLDLIRVISSKKPHDTGNKPVRFHLSKKQLASIVRYIDGIFEKEISEYKDKENQKKEGKIKTYEFPQEVWGAILIKNFIETNALIETKK